MTKTATFSPSADTIIASAAPDTNSSTTQALVAGNVFVTSDNIKRSLLRFDLSGVPSIAAVSAASLTLTDVSGYTVSAGSSFKVYRITQTSWTDTGVTWNKYDGSSTWTKGGEFSTALLDSHVIVAGVTTFSFSSMVGLVNDALQNRSNILDVIVAGSSTVEGIGSDEYIQFRSIENASTGTWPTLSITYWWPTVQAQWTISGRQPHYLVSDG